MQQAVRSRMAAGVVFAGVSALAITPIAPQLSEMAALPAPSSVQVELTSLVNPIAEYGDAFAKAFENTVALGTRIASDPAPILTQIIKNQLASAAGLSTFLTTAGDSVATTLAQTPEQLRDALEQLEAGNVSGALNTLVNTALAPIVQAVADTLLFNPQIWDGFQNALRQPIANVLAVVDLLRTPQIYNLLGPLLAPVQVITDVTGAVGEAGDDIVAGFKTADYEKVANAILSVGPAVTYALLNGTPISGDYAAGLLGPQGIVAGLLTIRDQIADAITPPAAAALKIEATAPETGALEAASAVTAGTPEKAVEAPTPATTDKSSETTAAETVSASPVAVTTDETTETPAAEESGTTGSTTVVKDSPKAVPGKTGTDTGDKAGREITKVRDGIRNTLKGVATGLKDVSDKLTGKSSKPAKADSSDSGSKAGESAGSE